MLNIILLFAYCWNLSPQLMHVCDTMYKQKLNRHESHYLCTFRNLFRDFAIDTLVGQDTHSVLWAKYYVLLMPLGVLTLMFCASRNTKKTAFRSKSNFLRIVLSSHCLWDKGPFAPPKKASCPGYGARRPLKWKEIVKLFLPYIASFCGLCHFIIERYEHYTKRTNFQI